MPALPRNHQGIRCQRITKAGMRPYGQRGKFELPESKRNAEGRALCRWCETPVPKGRRSWCSHKCVEEWRERGDWNHIRLKIIKRDKVCRLCGGQRWHGSTNHVYDREFGRLPFTYLHKGWDVDHIVACEDGGTDDPANLRLLCTQCHKERTRAQRRQKADERRKQISLLS